MRTEEHVISHPDRRHPLRQLREGDRRRDWLLRAIIDQLRRTPLITQRQLAEAIDHNYDSVRAALAKMLARKQCELVGRRFRLPDRFCRLTWALDAMTAARLEREALDQLEAFEALDVLEDAIGAAGCVIAAGDD